MVFLNVYDSEKPIYAFMANYMGNKIPVRIKSTLDDEWGSITTRSLLNEYYMVNFNAIGDYGEVNFSPIHPPVLDDVAFWVMVNLMQLNAEACDCND